MQLNSKREKAQRDKCMFPNVCFICIKYRLEVYNQTCYLLQYPSKVVTETADEKIEIGITKNDDREVLLVIAGFKLVAKEFQKREYLHNKHTRVPLKSDYSTSNTLWNI